MQNFCAYHQEDMGDRAHENICASVGASKSTVNHHTVRTWTFSVPKCGLTMGILFEKNSQLACLKKAIFPTRLSNPNNSCNFSRMTNLRSIYSFIHSVPALLHLHVQNLCGIEDSRMRKIRIPVFLDFALSEMVWFRGPICGPCSRCPRLVPWCARWQAFESHPYYHPADSIYPWMLWGSPRLLFFSSFISKRIELQFPTLSSYPVSDLVGLEETSSCYFSSPGPAFSSSIPNTSCGGKVEGVCTPISDR